MLLFILIPLYLLINFYIVWRSLRWLRTCHSFFGKKWFITGFVIVYVLLATSLVTSLIVPAGAVQRSIKVISNYWLGTLLYILLFMLLADLIRLILLPFRRRLPDGFFHSRKVHAAAGAAVFCLVALFSVYGIFHAHDTKVTSYSVTVDKSCAGRDSLKIALIADTHLGYNVGVPELQKAADLINEMQPDVIVLAGDIFDNDYDALDDPDRLIEIFQSMKSTYGIYACYGNHDVPEKLLAGFRLNTDSDRGADTRMDDFLKAAGIHLLSDESVLIDDAFYLAGRIDYSHGGASSRLSPDELLSDLDQQKPIIVIDHQPKELEELAEAGADLDLCGHTHDGQIFPGNLATRIAWENSCGLLKKGDMYNIVTSGVGLWGPNMRVGTDSEVVEITVEFEI